MWQDAEMTRKAGGWILSCLKSPRKDTTSMFWGVILATVVLTILFWASISRAEVTEASYYTVASCIKEGTSGIMANGRVLDDLQRTAASWDYKFGTRLLVRNLRNNREVVVSVTDRGPSKRLYRLGRKIDLSLQAAKDLGMVKQGLAKVEVTVI